MIILKRQHNKKFFFITCLHIVIVVPSVLSSPFWRRSTKIRGGGLSTNFPKEDSSRFYSDDGLRIEPGSALRHPQHYLRQGRNWFQISSEKCVDVLTNPKVLSTIQWGLMGYIVWETIRAAKQVYKDMLEDSDDYGSSGGSVDAILSANSAKKIVLWLEEDDPKLKGDPPSISPRWMLSLAQSLYACHAITGVDLYRILLNLTKPQAAMLQSALLRPSSRISFDCIAGLTPVKDAIQDWIGVNCKLDAKSPAERTPFDNLVSQGRQGVVLWGPPGCGKSLIINAIADKSGWPTLIVTPSLLQRKWFGESTNQVRTLFGLVSLLGRCTLVLDELDGLFRQRSREEHEANRELKTEWLQWWDGAASSNLQSNNHSKVAVIAATNRPWDIDPAMWRRLPQRFYVGVPTWDERCDLVHKTVESYRLPAVHPTVIEHLADSTEGYTPSDLFQILQYACRKGPMARSDTELSVVDVQKALNEVPPTRFSTQYILQLREFLGIANQQGPQQQHQYTSQVSYNPDQARCWQTPMGNYYSFNVPVDSDVFDIMEEHIWTENHEFESSDEESLYDEEESEESDDL